jgi:hypothetical protein
VDVVKSLMSPKHKESTEQRCLKMWRSSLERVLIVTHEGVREINDLNGFKSEVDEIVGSFEPEIVG